MNKYFFVLLLSIITFSLTAPASLQGKNLEDNVWNFVSASAELSEDQVIQILEAALPELQAECGTTVCLASLLEGYYHSATVSIMKIGAITGPASYLVTTVDGGNTAVSLDDLI